MNNELMNKIVISVSDSLEKLYEEDGASLIAKDLPFETYRNLSSQQRETYQHAAERSIVFRWAYYLNTLLESTFSEEAAKNSQPPYKIDLEYNRQQFLQKILDDQLILPDLIIHRRDAPDNLLIVECKGWWCTNKKEISDDKGRLKKLTEQTGNFRYQLGLFIQFEKSLRDTFDNLYWYWQGNEYEMDTILSLLFHGELQ
ncbi:hypothetical protein [Agathobaculum sp. Marseille-P7918]|uniref:hypothetical protein n=1 Tax=Agathobaculum sp. Marseille-P7918 TaxID=2479843 RepID=UPI000F640C10|nr:hypothetical protein [Agathobaculum sp. Marseille-P7918]